MTPTLWLLITLLLLVAFAVLLYAWDLIRRAVLGDRLLEACGGDWDSAVGVVEDARTDALMRRGMLEAQRRGLLEGVK
jgi:hypothetical protein